MSIAGSAQYDVAVMAAPAIEARLTGWLQAAGYRPSAWPPANVTFAQGSGAARPRTRGSAAGDEAAAQAGAVDQTASALWRSLPHRTLVTYLTDTATVMTRELLAFLPSPCLWLQLAPMPVEDAHHMARRARAAGVTMLHAPYLSDPATAPRPPYSAVYGPFSVLGRGRADHLVRAVTGHAEWLGPLETHAPEAHLYGPALTTARPQLR